MTRSPWWCRRVAAVVGLAGCAAAAACGGDAGGDPEAEASAAAEPSDVVRWEAASSEFLSPACQGQAEGLDSVSGLRSGSGALEGCAHARLSYPEVLGDGPLEEAMRAWTLEIVLQGGLFEAEPAGSPDDVVRNFVEAFDAYRAEVSGFVPGGWELDRRVDVLRATPPVVTLKASEFAYTGGAHPNSWVRYQSFHPDTGEPLTLERVLQPDAEPRVQLLVERQFREDVGLPPESPVQEAGLFEDLPLVDNMEFSPEGLTFHYNPYAVAPYAMGTIRVRVSWPEVAPHLDPDMVRLLNPWMPSGS